MGSNGPFRVMDAEEIEELRGRKAAGEHVDVLADEYGVSVRTIYRYLCCDAPTIVGRMQQIVEHWAELYALRLSPQERDALARSAAHAAAIAWERGECERQCGTCGASLRSNPYVRYCSGPCRKVGRARSAHSRRWGVSAKLPIGHLTLD